MSLWSSQVVPFEGERASSKDKVKVATVQFASSAYTVIRAIHNLLGSDKHIT